MLERLSEGNIKDFVLDPVPPALITVFCAVEVYTEGNKLQCSGLSWHNWPANDAVRGVNQAADFFRHLVERVSAKEINATDMLIHWLRQAIKWPNSPFIWCSWNQLEAKRRVANPTSSSKLLVIEMPQTTSLSGFFDFRGFVSEWPDLCAIVGLLEKPFRICNVLPYDAPITFSPCSKVLSSTPTLPISRKF